jgi:hypothetical protein
MAKKNKLGAAVSKPVPVKIVPNSSEPYTTSKADKDREMRYRAEDALRDIQRAEKHKKDGALMKCVKQLAQEQMDGLKQFAKK